MEWSISTQPGSPFAQKYQVKMNMQHQLLKYLTLNKNYIISNEWLQRTNTRAYFAQKFIGKEKSFNKLTP